MPAERIVVKPHFVDAAPASGGPRAGGLFVGRLTRDKGAALLLDAIDRAATTITVIGDGPEAARVAAHPRARALGRRPPAGVQAAMLRHAYLVAPSVAPETFGRAVIEAFACGLPVIASRRGALAELVDDGRTGLLFDPDSPDELAARLRWAESHPRELAQLGERARDAWRARYTPDASFRQLMHLYGDAIAAPKEQAA